MNSSGKAGSIPDRLPRSRLRRELGSSPSD